MTPEAAHKIGWALLAAIAIISWVTIPIMVWRPIVKTETYLYWYGLPVLWLLMWLFTR